MANRARYPVYMRDRGLLYPVRLLSRIAAVLLPVVLVAGPINPDLPDFSGEWIEIQPDHGPPLGLQLMQSGSRVRVRGSYRDSFSEKDVATATIDNGTATFTLSQGCVARFQWPGYNYDSPGKNVFTLSLRQPAETGQPKPLLIYVQESYWYAPCSNHQIGVERIEKVLKRR